MKNHNQSPVLLIFFGLLVLALLILSCSMLQNTPEYRHYQKNTLWKQK
jgi:hypothetical protein